MNVYRIKADLKIAKKALEGENEEQSYCIDVASFLTQQTIEKSLKYMLHDVHGVDDTTRKFKIHSIIGNETVVLQRRQRNCRLR